MKIDNKLNLVVTAETENGTVYIHHAPISYACFKQHFLIITKVHDAINSEGIALSGARVAYLMLEQLSDESGVSVRDLINEIKRLTNVIVPSNGNWEHIPLDDAHKEKIIDDEQLDEVLNAVVFFTCICAVGRGKPILEWNLKNMAARWGLQTTLLNCVEYAKQLPILTEIGNTSKTAS